MVQDETKNSGSVFKVDKTLLFFFLKLFALIIIWECSYNFILKPARVPDKILTNTVTSAVVRTLNIFSRSSAKFSWAEGNPDYFGEGQGQILRNGKEVFYIADECNALSLMVIYIGFIILLPYPFKRKIVFIVGGIIGLIIANIIRCTMLYWIYRNHPSVFEFNHHYLFTVIMYLLIFYGWVLFTKGGRINEVA